MALDDYYERLAMIANEGPLQTAFQSMRGQRGRNRTDFLKRVEDEKKRLIQFAVTIPHQNYQDQQIQMPTGEKSSAVPLPGYNGLNQYPLHGKLRVSSPYGVHRKGHKSAHTGIDWAASSGTPIYAPAGGVVRSAHWDKIYGNQTIIDLGGGRSIMLGHQSGFNIKPGQRINSGQVVGYVGSTGWSTGPHLHFETWINNRPVNPLSWFS